MERGEAAVIACFDVGSGLDQRRGRSWLIGEGRLDQWRLAVLVAAVHITALGHKLLNLVSITRPRSVMQRRCIHFAACNDETERES